jgi:Ni/Fe-hydrogenase 1 B-type cytochrome subunit
MGVTRLKEERHPLFYRILHEIMMTSILFLIVTGLYIHRPFIGSSGFSISLTRGIHFFFAWILILTFVLRVVSMLVGPYRDWRSFVPSIYDIESLPKFMLYYARMGSQPEVKKKYNPLQMLTYCGILLLILFQIFSGFALEYVNNPAISWFNDSMFANVIQTRLAHYIATWAFILFLIIHVYLVVRENASELKVVHLMRKSEETDKAV